MTRTDFKSGPIIRANQPKLKAVYSIVFHNAKVLVIKDEYAQFNSKSVTNDAEAVVKDIFDNILQDKNIRIFYIDTQGRCDELIHENGVFKDYKLGYDSLEKFEESFLYD